MDDKDWAIVSYLVPAEQAIGKEVPEMFVGGYSICQVVKKDNLLDIDQMKRYGVNIAYAFNKAMKNG